MPKSAPIVLNPKIHVQVSFREFEGMSLSLRKDREVVALDSFAALQLLKQTVREFRVVFSSR